MAALTVLGAEQSFYPITVQQACDEATLGATILRDETLASRTHPGQRVRWVKVRFFSHDWKDGPWHATMNVAMPPAINPEDRGLAAITVAGVAKKGAEPGFDVERDLIEHTAMEFGIPVATMPQQGTHFGLTEIHELSDHLTRRFVETRDPSWLSAYCGAAVRARAVTMLGKLVGHPIESVVHMGGSITAGQGWVWAAFDDRAKGLVASGSIGPFTSVYPDRPLRERLNFLAEAPDDIKQLFLQHRDPIQYARRIDCKVLIATGSNDFACPPAVMPEFLEAFRGPTSVATVPNAGHSPGTRRHAETFRMWIDHVLFDRSLTHVEIDALSYRAGSIVCQARVEGRPEVREVRLVFAGTDNPDFLASRFSEGASPDNYTQAKWQSVPMRHAGENWAVTVELQEPRPHFVACFVDAHDEYGDRPGYATSLTRQTETE